MTAEQVRALVRGRLKLWGEYQRYGYLPGRGDGIRSGNKPDSRLPAPDWFFDLSRAFAALNENTPIPVASNGRIKHLAQSRFTPQQRTLWLYYVEAADAPPPDMHRADRTQWEHEREREQELAIKARDWRHDNVIAERLGLSARTARRYRTGAVWALALLVGWGEEEAA